MGNLKKANIIIEVWVPAETTTPELAEKLTKERVYPKLEMALQSLFVKTVRVDADLDEAFKN